MAIGTNGGRAGVACTVTFGTTHGIVCACEREGCLAVIESRIAITGGVTGVAGIRRPGITADAHMLPV